MARKPAEPGKIGKHIHRIPIMSRTHPDYASHLAELGIRQVVALEDLGVATRGKLEKAGIIVHDFHLEPYHSFDGPYPEKMLQAARTLKEAEENGIPTALSCTFGQRRSARVGYLFHRMMGKGHLKAVSAVRPRQEDEERLRELHDKN